MDNSVLAAVITGLATVAAAVIAVLPHLRKKEPGSRQDPVTPPPQRPGADRVGSLSPRGEHINLVLASTKGEPRPHTGPSSVPPAPRPAPEDAVAGSTLKVIGVSASAQRTPREIDFDIEGEEIRIHIHPPGGDQAKAWVRRFDLQAAFEQWLQSDQEVDRVEVQARSARKPMTVVFVISKEDEVEVQTQWWIWIDKGQFKSALETLLGTRLPWDAKGV